MAGTTKTSTKTPKGDGAAKKAAPKKKAASPATNGAFTPDTPDVRVYRGSGRTHESLGLSADDVLEMYRNMLLQRRFEERAAQMYGRQKIAGFLHLYIGQEAVSTGAVRALRDDDPIITAYRDHGLALARGMSSDAGMAELFGKIDGCSRGKGGSMHFFDVEKHFYGGHGIVGGQIPVGVGMGFALKYRETGGVALAFFGDGAINQGAFHEAANLASLYDVPVLLIVENNEYAMGTSVARARGDANLYKQGYPYGMKTAVIDGMDLFEVYGAFQEIADDARGETDGQTKPYFVEVQTYRYRGHSMSDPQKYRTKEELEGKKGEDPILRVKAYILEHELFPVERLDEVDEDVKAEVMAAVDFAEQSPLPDVSTMYEDVYAQEDYPFIV
ncbi:pyruvate dehydrogenase (acetyl-transferring) E1 component subunit alpha [Rubrivirga sp. S365]|uniref:pyruvate dehydrogenase (acetyl-transferring) E1 component subunit alpha n=1 Tax=Rubrivirga sp. S365 TaxID=3076080 RepID=UPI0028C5FE06|nr:pyruvate dehydrogenase (acetyl-transferring) E1 component subunit alpha [Rubrivirga sp. S365]MDT7857060.1 pyruvate dehydrogenase (acetyl-transferring) E1 component subunit alpha [Rubrivirga sp. S365]